MRRAPLALRSILLDCQLAEVVALEELDHSIQPEVACLLRIRVCRRLLDAWCAMGLVDLFIVYQTWRVLFVLEFVIDCWVDEEIHKQRQQAERSSQFIQPRSRHGLLLDTKPAKPTDQPSDQQVPNLQSCTITITITITTAASIECNSNAIDRHIPTKEACQHRYQCT
jgi:hypothetical protein